MLGSENQMEILPIGSGIVAIPLFKIDISSSSKCIRFGSESSGSETNDQIESRKVFGPTCLPMREDFGGRKILQILMIGDHVDREHRAFEIVSPSFESFENCE